MLGGPWVGILCHLDLPTWITHTALAVNNHPLYSLYNPLHGPRVGTHALQRLYISAALYSPLQPSTSLHLYILYSIHPSLYITPQTQRLAVTNGRANGCSPVNG